MNFTDERTPRVHIPTKAGGNDDDGDDGHTPSRISVQKRHLQTY